MASFRISHAADNAASARFHREAGVVGETTEEREGGGGELAATAITREEVDVAIIGERRISPSFNRTLRVLCTV